jgi:putative tryptophan/tyrosine transport system substrate-binding protein
MIGRREFITLLGGGAAAAWPIAARAQQPQRLRRVGVLQGLSADDQEWQPRLAAFRLALAELGWIEDRNVQFEFRYANGNPARLPGLAAELVQSQVDLIITNAAQPIEAVRAATSKIPIVMASVGDALGAGYISSLAHPGGNITGLTLFATEQSGKRLELVKEIAPNLVRVAAIWNGNASGHRLQMKELEPAASKLALALQSLPIVKPDEIDAAFQAAQRASAQAILTMDDPMIQLLRGQIVDLAMRQRVILMGEFRAMPLAGALMSYAPSQVDMWRRSASYVDKILKGAKPADLPVQQPTKFELVINLKTAKALGLSVPDTVLARADEVIE